MVGEDRIIGFVKLEAVLGVEDRVGFHGVQRFRQLASGVDTCRLKLRHRCTIGPFGLLAAPFGQELAMRHTVSLMRAAVRVTQKRYRRRPVAEIQAGTFDRRVDNSHGLHPGGAQGRLYAGKLF